MNIRPKLRNAALVGALAAVTATAWATTQALSDAPYVAPTPIAVEAPTVIAPESVTPSESLAPNETVVTPTEMRTYEPSPAARLVERNTEQAPIVVEARRLSEDERIQAIAIDKIAMLPNISGKIGVVSHDSVVTLSGYTTTAGQAYRAGRAVGSIVGVKYVQNEIRPRIGGSV